MTLQVLQYHPKINITNKDDKLDRMRIIVFLIKEYRINNSNMDYYLITTYAEVEISTIMQ